MRFLLSLSCLIILFLDSMPFRQASEHSGQIRGVVVDSNGAYVPDVTISIKGKHQDFESQTAQDGSYSLTLPSGEYQFIARRIGFCPMRRAIVTIKPELKANIDLTLFVCPITNSIIIEKGQYKAENDHYQFPFKEDKIPPNILIGMNHELMIQYGERTLSKEWKIYKGFNASGQYHRTIVSYNLITIYANVLQFNAQDGLLEAEGDITFNDGKNYTRAAKMSIYLNTEEPIIKLK